MFIDPSGQRAVFYQRKNGDWTFLMDDKVTNVTIGLFGFVPFLDNGIWWATDKLSGMESISRHLVQDIITSLGASLGAGSRVNSIAGGTSKFAKAAGKLSDVLTSGNIFYELRSDNSYVNQITAKIFDGNYNATSFDWTAKYFVAYAAITKDMIDKNIITYEKDKGKAIGISYDKTAFDNYFKNLEITPADVAKMVRGYQ